MDVREKLVELIRETGMVENENRCKIIAEELMQNGVTVQECGYWIKTETNSTCSKCGGNVISWSGEYDGYERERGICLMHYCPHCGARMMPQPPKGE